MPLPLSSFEMIVICVLFDIPTELGLILEGPESNLLEEPPISPDQHLIDGFILGRGFFALGFLESLFATIMHLDYYKRHCGLELNDVMFIFDKWTDGFKGFHINQLNEFNYYAQTIFFTGLCMMQLFGNYLATKSVYLSFFTTLPCMEKTRNLWFIWLGFISFGILMICNYVPFINDALNTRWIPWEYYFIGAAFGLLILFADEIRKIIHNYIREKNKISQKKL